MKDAEVAEHSSQTIQILPPQTAEQQVIAPTGRAANGRFATGNIIHNESSRGRGFAKIQSRVEAILDHHTVADINYATEHGQFEGLQGLDAVAYRKARGMVYGFGEHQDTMDRIEGQVAKKTEITGKDGGPVVMVTADVTQILLDASSKAIKGK